MILNVGTALVGNLVFPATYTPPASSVGCRWSLRTCLLPVPLPLHCSPTLFPSHYRARSLLPPATMPSPLLLCYPAQVVCEVPLFVVAPGCLAVSARRPCSSSPWRATSSRWRFPCASFDCVWSYPLSVALHAPPSPFPTTPLALTCFPPRLLTPPRLPGSRRRLCICRPQTTPMPGWPPPPPP
ncbi:hypothetical protein I4F81_007424 [Pyropia yezoensis]|uniref:Uncharacterized protein n=1 Tax=Pyropia yezoensis TaxID=2788 RepID=A0ACC3C512_PYRYE|nr:hypothetical protein I4F81_007424 [Neopyropia yezoensis]